MFGSSFNVVKGSDGKVVPCLSFDFDGDCKISQQAAAPKGSGTLSESATGNYFEKICIDCKSVLSWLIIRIFDFSLV